MDQNLRLLRDDNAIDNDLAAAAIAEERRRFGGGGMPSGGTIAPMAPPSPPGASPPPGPPPSPPPEDARPALSGPVGPPPQSISVLPPDQSGPPPAVPSPSPTPQSRGLAPGMMASPAGPTAQDRAAAKLGLIPMPASLSAAADRSERDVKSIQDRMESRQEKQAQIEGALRDQASDDLAALNARNEARAAQQRAKEEKALKHIDSLAADVRSTKIDPNGFYAKQGTGSRLFSALAMAMGAYSAAINKTSNFAMDIINKGIDDDIAAQRANLENKRAGVEEAKGLYSRLRQQGLDDEAAASGAKAAYMEHAQAKLAAMTAGNRPADLRDKYDLMNASLEQAKIASRTDAARALARETFAQQKEMAAESAAAEQKRYGRAVEAYKLGQEDRKIDNEADKSRGESALRAAQIKEYANKERSLVVPLSTGGYGRARTVEEAKDYRLKSAAFEAIDSGFEMANKYREEIARGENLAGNLKALRGLEAELMQQVSKYQGQGAMNGGDAEIAKKAIGGFTSFMPGTSKAIKDAQMRYTKHFEEFQASQLVEETDAAGEPLMQPGIKLGPVR